VVISNVHLPSDPYGPYWVRGGEPRSAVLELERTTRLPAIQTQLDVLPELAADGFPVFLTGDFNSPSHLDWTPAVDAVREEVRYSVEWPVSKALAGVGFRDSYREVHPNPVATPGFTWTPPGTLESVPDEVHDRIDWVLSAGPTETIATALVGEAGGPDVDIERDPYPTDHRGVVSTFEVTPADPDPFTAVATRRVFVGDDLDVRFHGGARVVFVRRGDGPGEALASRSTGGIDDGSVTFGTEELEPGVHEAALLSPSGAVLSRSPFWLYPAGVPPRVRVVDDVFEVGEPIEVGGGPRPDTDGTGWVCSLPGAARSRTRRTATPAIAETGTTSSTRTRTRGSKGAPRWDPACSPATRPGRSPPGTTRSGC
jgi:hypothetical protein